MIHLDTSFLIRMLEPGSPEAQFLEAADSEEPIVVSTIAWAEFLCGPIEPAEKDFALQIVDGHRDLTLEHAGIAARLFNESGRRRRSLSDCLIAAAAIHDGARLATTNLGDFRRFAAAGLKLV